MLKVEAEALKTVGYGVVLIERWSSAKCKQDIHPQGHEGEMSITVTVISTCAHNVM